MKGWGDIMSVLNVDSTSNNLSVSSKNEKCIHCGKDINIHKDLYIELNKNHAEKSGKLCQDCYRKIHKNTYSVNKPYIKIKRILDFILSLFAIIVLSPIYVVIAVLIRKEDGGPVLYKHTRIGKNGKKFGVYKFRSMTTKYKTFDEFYQTLSDEQKKEWNENYKLSNDPRVTKIGNFLRKTSLDELPQIFNILKGEMSIIGPRPIINEELEKYKENKSKLLSVLPGLTGYWAANGRSDTTYEQRMEMELYYIDHISFLLDIKIFFKTIISVLKKEGAK